MSHLLHGPACPCRFPRFRATVERETLSFGAPLMTWEQYLLIGSFDRAVSLVNRRPLVTRGEGTGHEGNCARCGAFVRRSSEEKFRDQWIEHMVVQPCPGLEDLGAAVDGPVPHCWPFFAAASTESERRDAERARLDAEVTCPRISLDAWITWMKALRAPAPAAQKAYLV